VFDETMKCAKVATLLKLPRGNFLRRLVSVTLLQLYRPLIDLLRFMSWR